MTKTKSQRKRIKVEKEKIELICKKVMKGYLPTLVKFDVNVCFRKSDGTMSKFPAKKIIDLKEYTMKAIKLGFQEGRK